MKQALFTCILLAFFSPCAYAQYQTDSIISLKAPLTESSGLLFLNGTFITHGDSGNPPALYEIDTLTGLPSRTVYVANATNIDWEDLAADDDYIYIGDFGNNQGTRQNLRIYKVAQADYWANDTVFADTINFSYADQTSFTPAPFQTNYDCEAMVSRGDSLYVLTKQWGTPGSKIYRLPKTPGTFSLLPYDTLTFAQGLVTGAEHRDFGILTMLDVLLNTASGPILRRYQGQYGTFSGKLWQSDTLNVFGSIQVEGICITNVGRHFFSSETFAGQKAMLSRVSIGMDITEDALNAGFKLYPNPTNGPLTVDFGTPKSGELTIYTLTSKALQKVAFDKVSQLELAAPELPGVYFLEVIFSGGQRGVQRVVKY